MAEHSRSQIAQDAFLARREQLGRTLGVQTVDLLIERSLIEIAPAFPLLSGIAVDGAVLRLDSLPLAFHDATGHEVETALNALTAVMLLLLGRLIGKPVAEMLAEQLKGLSEPPIDDSVGATI